MPLWEEVSSCCNFHLYSMTQWGVKICQDYSRLTPSKVNKVPPEPGITLWIFTFHESPSNYNRLALTGESWEDDQRHPMLISSLGLVDNDNVTKLFVNLFLPSCHPHTPRHVIREPAIFILYFELHLWIITLLVLKHISKPGNITHHSSALVPW